jgi:hypothetical protein
MILHSTSVPQTGAGGTRGKTTGYTFLMIMPSAAMSITDWAIVETTEHPGDTGVALWKTKNFGAIRVRMVEYSAGYSADHWCAKGHLLLCLSGSLAMELADGMRLALAPGQSYHVGDGDPPHRSSTKTGAKLFIVD